MRPDDVLCSRNSADFRGYSENEVLRRILHVDACQSTDNPGVPQSWQVHGHTRCEIIIYKEYARIEWIINRLLNNHEVT